MIVELFDLKSLKVRLLRGKHAELFIESKDDEPNHIHSKELVKMILSHDLTNELRAELNSKISKFKKPKLSVEIKINLEYD